MGRPVEAQVLGDDLWLEKRLHARVGGHTTQATVDARGVSHEAIALLFTEVLRAAGWLPLHASVVARDGRAVAITGYSGAGKSTAVLRLAGLGYQVISEDRTFWQPATGLISGLDRHLRAFPDSVERFAPALLPAVLTGERDSKGKLLLPLLKGQEPARLMELLTLGEGQALSGPERVRAAWEATGVPLTNLARERVQVGVNRLIPLVRSPGVTRESVIEVVQGLLGS